MHQRQRQLPRVAVACLTTFLVVFAGLGCGSSEPKSPVTLDESTSIAGPDRDENGVRDDIDEVIASLPVAPEMRTYLSQSAAVEQRIMMLDINGDPAAAKSEAFRIATDANRLISCVPAGLDEEEANDRTDVLQSLIEDTDERQAQVAAFSKLINGRSFPEPRC